MAVLQGAPYLFSASKDGTIKAWEFMDQQANAPTGALKCVMEKQIGQPINTLQMANKDFLIAGVDNGQFVGWMLTQDKMEAFPAHQASITSVVQHENVLVSGDFNGSILVHNTQDFSKLLQGQRNIVMQPGKQPLQNNKIITQCVYTANGNPYIFAGDAQGYITCMTNGLQPGAQSQCITFAAHVQEKDQKT